MPKIHIDNLTTKRYDYKIQAQMNSILGLIIEQAHSMDLSTHNARSQLTHAINCIAYMYQIGDSEPVGWSTSNPLVGYIDYSEDELKDNLKGHIHDQDIDWGNVGKNVQVSQPLKKEEVVSSDKVIAEPIKKSTKSTYPLSKRRSTDKSDLYIQPPIVPQFNVNKVWKSGVVDGSTFAIYSSYPEVPTKQNEISCTTSINMMDESSLLNLYPTEFIRTRAACMYEEVEGIELHPTLGLILPIEGYSRDQLIDNLIRYPHIFKLMKQVDDKIETFYATVEIDQQLHKVADIWETLPEASLIPYTKEFIKEYVVRRYILERDVNGVQHRYKLCGTLDPFLTLFTTPEDYKDLGYPDAISMARACVLARVSYKQSRNPVLRRLANA